MPAAKKKPGLNTKTIKVDFSIKTVKMELIGATPLICHRFGEKAKKEIIDTVTGVKRSKKKEPKNPKKEFEESLYKLPSGKYGFPAVAFKRAAVRAAKGMDYKMIDVTVAMHVRSVEQAKSGEGCVHIISKGKPAMREDMVRVNTGGADVRYRGEFKNWKVEIFVDYDPGVLDVQAIANMYARAGKFGGVGDWRVEKNGIFGTWNMGKIAEVQYV